MYWCDRKFLVLLTLVCGVFCLPIDESEDSSETTPEKIREHRSFEDENWRAVQTHQPDEAQWTPGNEDPAEQEDTLLKRRRLRKRRRRPQLESLTVGESEEQHQERLIMRRKMRPQRLEQLPEPWEEMSDEAVHRPYIRRRVTPVYESSEENTSSTKPEPLKVKFIEPSAAPQTVNYERVRDPFTALQEDEAKSRQKKKQEEVMIVTPVTTNPPDLKSLLKQSGGLSLSEILQQKNISLAELLKGEQHAIKALTEKPETITEAFIDYRNFAGKDTVEPTKYKRLPPSVGLRKNLNRNFETDEDSSETLSPKETLDAQRRRLAILGAKETKMYTDVTKYDVITEPSTDRRIFVPSHPKLYTSIDYKPDLVEIHVDTTQFLEETTTSGIKNTEEHEFKTEEITRHPSSTPYTLLTRSKDYPVNRITMKPLFKSRLPITSAKLNKLTTTSSLPNTENYPPFSVDQFKPIQINLDEIYGLSNTNKEVQEDDGPLKMSINLDRLLEKPVKVQEDEENHNFHANLIKAENYPINKIKFPEIKFTTKKPMLEKLKAVSAKDELMEILRDPISREKLSRILDRRNMTLQELVDLRERGSSQVHLADIFHNKKKEPEPKNEPAVGRISIKPSNPYPIFGRKQKSNSVPVEIKKDSQGSSYFTSVVDIKPVEENQDGKISNSKDIYTVTSFPTYKIEMDKNTNENNPRHFFPVWGNINPSVYTDLYESNYKKVNLNNYRVQTTNKNDQNDLQRLEDIENRISEAVNEKLNVNLNDNKFEDDDDGIKLPTGVRSAIVASTVIVGISLAVFLTILVVFRWSQKQKHRLCYSSSFSGSRIKSPILEGQPKRTIKTIMTETLGRTKNYQKAQLQSMSDNMWENDKKPFQ